MWGSDKLLRSSVNRRLEAEQRDQELKCFFIPNPPLEQKTVPCLVPLSCVGGIDGYSPCLFLMPKFFKFYSRRKEMKPRHAQVMMLSDVE